MTLLSVHHRKREATRLLLALLGQLDQLGKLLVDHLDQGRVLLGERLQKFRIIGLQFRGEVRVANLETNSKPPVAFQSLALVVAVQSFVVFRFDRS